MLTYHYQWVLYRPDVFSGEFVIMGFVCWFPERAVLQHYLTPSIQRATQFFSNSPAYAKNTLRTGLKNFDQALYDLQAESLVSHMSLADLMQRVLPDNENALQLSPIKQALCLNPEAAYQKLIKQIEKYSKQPPVSLISDNDLQQSLQRAFKKYEVYQYLSNFQVTPKNGFPLPFNHAWVNGRVNLYHPVSLDLKSEKYAIRKIKEVKGEIDMLDDDIKGQEFMVHLISAPPKHMKGTVQERLSTTLHSTLKSSSERLERVRVSIYAPEEIDTLAKQTQQQILKYLQS